MIHWLAQSHDVLPQTAVNGSSFQFLSEKEAARLASLQTEKRRRDWLLGRWTAKRLLQTVIWETKYTTVPLDLITVSNNADGVPTVESQLPMINGKFSISISHSHGQALVTAVAKPNWPIGCDIERIEPRLPGFVEDYFTAEEQEIIAYCVLRDESNYGIRNTQYERRNTLVTAVWSAKEAVLKALHLGLSVDTRAISCLIDPGERPSGTWVPFKIKCDNTRLPKEAPHFSGWWRTMDQFVMTLVIKQ